MIKLIAENEMVLEKAKKYRLPMYSASSAKMQRNV
jgi:hypothetical protein